MVAVIIGSKYKRHAVQRDTRHQTYGSPCHATLVTLRSIQFGCEGSDGEVAPGLLFRNVDEAAGEMPARTPEELVPWYTR